MATPRDRLRSVVLLAAAGLLAVAAAFVGLADNPPGLLLAFAAAAAFVVAFVHHWRTPRQFRFLALAAGLGFGLFAILHNVFEALAGNMGDLVAVRAAFQGLGVAAFLVAVLLCPPALLVGVAGVLVSWACARRRQVRGTAS